MTRSIAFIAALSVLGLAACGQSGSSAGNGATGDVTVANAFCRPTPNGRQVTGCYLTLTAPTADTLVSVSSPVAALAQIHETKMESNMMMMHELEAGLPLPAGEAVTLAPGANHIMLMGVTEPLRVGDTVELTLNFATAAKVDITATVAQPPAA